MAVVYAVIIFFSELSKVFSVFTYFNEKYWKKAIIIDYCHFKNCKMKYEKRKKISVKYNM